MTMNVCRPRLLLATALLLAPPGRRAGGAEATERRWRQAVSDENLLLLRSKVLAAEYAENWHEHAQHSEPYAGAKAFWPYRETVIT